MRVEQSAPTPAAADLDARVEASQHRRKTAGDMITGGAFGLPGTATVGEAIGEIRSRGDRGAPSHHVYVIGPQARLAGVVSMRDLVLARPHTSLSRLMHTPAVAVRATDDPEHVARVMRRHDLVALPVVDEAGGLAGVVTADDVMGAIEVGDTEEVQQLFGAGTDERLTSPWHFSFRKRLPWLLVNLALATLGASVIGFFEGTLGAWTVLAMYMPVVAGMGGNASAQAMAVAVRGIAVGDADRVTLRRVVLRKLRVGATSGLVTGALAAGVAALLHWDHGPVLGVLVAVSLFVNQTVACAWGAAVPYVMRWLGQDPAQSATIFTTTLTDALGFFTLLGLSSLSLRVLN